MSLPMTVNEKGTFVVISDFKIKRESMHEFPSDVYSETCWQKLRIAC